MKTLTRTVATRRHLFENRYCNGCQCTTKHENRVENTICIRCGVLKFPIKKVS